MYLGRLEVVVGHKYKDNILPTGLSEERLVCPSIDSPEGNWYPDPI